MTEPDHDDALPPEPPEEDERDENAPPEDLPPLRAAKASNKRKNANLQRKARGERHVNWTSKESHYVWSEIADMLKIQARSPAEVVCYVSRVDPPPDTEFGCFTCDALGGGGADAFFRYLVSRLHNNFIGAAVYRTRFQWRNSSDVIANTTVRMPPREEIAALSAAAPAPSTPYGVGAPHYGGWRESEPYAPTQDARPPWGRESPPAHGDNSEVAQLRAQVGFLSGQIESMMVAMRTGQPPPPASPPPVAPHLQETVELLRQLGVIPNKAGVGAPPLAPAPVYQMPALAPAAQASGALGEIMSLVRTMKSLKEVKGDLEGLFGATAPAAAAELVKDDEGLPFDVIPVGEMQMGGQQVNYARNRATGKLDLEGTLFSNPVVAERLMELGAVLAKGAASSVGIKLPQPDPNATQVVSAAPTSAFDAMPIANGAAHAQPHTKPWPKI